MQKVLTSNFYEKYKYKQRINLLNKDCSPSKDLDYFFAEYPWGSYSATTPQKLGRENQLIQKAPPKSKNLPKERVK